MKYPDTYSHPTPPQSTYSDMLVNLNQRFIAFLDDFYCLTNKEILDYGCGTGAFSKLFSLYSPHVTGADLSTCSLEFAEKTYGSDICWVNDDYFDCSLPVNQYDFMFCRCLVPLVKMEYNDQAKMHLKRLIQCLKYDGVAYFIIYGNASGKADPNIDLEPTAFRHNTIKQLYDFYSTAGEVAMINMFGYQAIVVSQSRIRADELQRKMWGKVLRNMRSLKAVQWVDYYKFKLWLYLNRGQNFSSKDLPELGLDKAITESSQDFQFLDEYMAQNTFSGDYEKIAKGICKRNLGKPNIIQHAFNSEIFLISGDQDYTFTLDFFREFERLHPATRERINAQIFQQLSIERNNWLEKLTFTDVARSLKMKSLKYIRRIKAALPKLISP